jgi:glycosyltransferase involved in cell wall biosynthesis
MSVYIVIAAYNEGKSILNVISKLRDAHYDNIVIVDDGSKDDTYNIALESGVTVLRHVVNRGQGAALKTGIDYAYQNGADFIVTFDADGQHRVEDLDAMIAPVMNDECDVTLGSRFLKPTKMPLSRKLMLKFAILIVWVFYGVKMTDAHNGFRVLNRVAASTINITSDRMEHASQIVEEIYKKKLRYKEVSVTILYTDYSLEHGQGGFKQAIKVFSTMIVRKILK